MRAPHVPDYMDELSAFVGAPKALRLSETELLATADLAFTGGASLYQAKRPVSKIDQERRVPN